MVTVADAVAAVVVVTANVAKHRDSLRQASGPFAGLLAPSNPGLRPRTLQTAPDSGAVFLYWGGFVAGRLSFRASVARCAAAF